MSVIAIPAAGQGQVMSRADLAGYYINDLTRSALRMLLRRVRTRDRVTSEYEAGSWQRVLDQRAWLASSDLAAFLTGDDTRTMVAKVDGKVVKITARDYYRQRLAVLVDAIGEYVVDGGELVEVGCGWGQNLFALSLTSRWPRLSGLDISENGLRAGRAIAEHFGLVDRVLFDSLDLTDASHPNFQQIEGRSVFTFCCIEQVPDAVEHVIDNIRRNGPRRVIHIEPTTELLNLWRPLDVLNYMYVKSMHYQTRLFSTLAGLEQAGKVRILAQRRLSCAPTIHNDIFLVVWEPSGH